MGFGTTSKQIDLERFNVVSGPLWGSQNAFPLPLTRTGSPAWWLVQLHRRIEAVASEIGEQRMAICCFVPGYQIRIEAYRAFHIFAATAAARKHPLTWFSRQIEPAPGNRPSGKEI